jgi:type II secretory pathway component PulJ
MLRPGTVLLDYYLTGQDVFIFSFDAKGGFSWRKETLRAGFRLVLHGLSTELLHGFLRELKARHATARQAAGLPDTLTPPIGDADV